MNSQEEIDYLKRRGDLFYDFIISKTTETSVIEDVKTTFSRLYVSRDLRGLREINKELDTWSRNLPTQQDSVEFWKILKSELGEDYPSAYSKQIQTIKKKGIRNEFEHQLIEECVNELCQSGNADVEVQELNELLTKFDAKGGRNI